MYGIGGRAGKMRLGKINKGRSGRRCAHSTTYTYYMSAFGLISHLLALAR